MITRRAAIIGGGAALASPSIAQVPGVVAGPGLFGGTNIGSTWNPSDMASGITLSNSNWTMATTTGSRNVRATTSRNTGKYYFETKLTLTTGRLCIGVMTSSGSLGSSMEFSPYAAVYVTDGQFIVQGTLINNTSTAATNDIIGVAVDLTSNKISFYKNNSLMVSGGNISIPSGTYFPACGSAASASSNVAGIGGFRFLTYTPPTGYLAWG